ncbi:GntR family transcriptional regulator [Brooklawnia cerclae]
MRPAPYADPVTEDDGLDLAERTAQILRERLITGAAVPGEQLSEAALATDLEVSRNTLREAFRILIHEGSLERIPNRGVFVRVPSVSSVLDVFRVRRAIEVMAVREALPKHPAIADARAAVERAKRARDIPEWTVVGTANMEFHSAIVDLAESPRLSTFFQNVLAELRIAFVSLSSPEYLHAPFVDQNEDLTILLEQGKMAEAATELEAYLVRSERLVLAAFGRMGWG